MFDNFSPKYVNIEHVVTQNESLNSILKNYEINDKELKLISKELNSKVPNYTLKINQKINFTINKKMKVYVNLLHSMITEIHFWENLTKAEKFKSKDKEELTIKVTKAKGTKCPRCWKILESKCVRCEKAITENV